VKHLAWLLPVGAFAGAILLGLESCDSDDAFTWASIMCVVTGLLAGGIRFIHRGREADNVFTLVGAAFLALVVALPVTVVTWFAMVIVAAIHCGNFEVTFGFLGLHAS
jgi:hypothetical protein